jgi:hypothetical protein
MKTALLVIAVWAAVSLPLALFCGRLLAWTAGRPPRAKPPRMAQGRRWRHGWRVMGCAALCLLALAACGGGGSAAPAAVASSVGVGGCQGGAANGCTSNAPPPFACPAGQQLTGYGPTSCCPIGDGYNASTQQCVAPPTCPVGQSLTGYGSQCCPTGDTGNGTQCFAPPPPPPATCPSNTYGTPPNCQPIPVCSAVVGGYWGGPAAGCECPAAAPGKYPACVAPCPAGDTGAPPNCVPPPVCTGGYWGGIACECPAGDVGTYPNCIAQGAIKLTVSANVDPTTVVDNSAGSWVTAPQTSTLSMAVTSTLPGDTVLCTVNGAGTPMPPAPVTVGPFVPSQDGSGVVYNVSCSDPWTTASAPPVTLAVIAPSQPPPPDTFTSFANGDGTYTFNWYSYGSQGCSVQQADNSGNLTTLVPGGTTSGSATTAVLTNPSITYTFTLICGGVPDPTVQPITVTP